MMDQVTLNIMYWHSSNCRVHYGCSLHCARNLRPCRDVIYGCGCGCCCGIKIVCGPHTPYWGIKYETTCHLLTPSTIIVCLFRMCIGRWRSLQQQLFFSRLNNNHCFTDCCWFKPPNNVLRQFLFFVVLLLVVFNAWYAPSYIIIVVRIYFTFKHF